MYSVVQRLGSATLPFTVLSLAINPSSEDYLAVCGLKVLYAYHRQMALIVYVSKLGLVITFPLIEATLSLKLLPCPFDTL